jgi:putative membrane protein
MKQGPIYRLFAILLTLTIFASCQNSPRTGSESTDTMAGTTHDTLAQQSMDTTTAVTPSVPLTDPEKKFLQEEVEANYAEIHMARLATEKSTNDDVKNVAKVLEADHSLVLTSLNKIAGDNSVTVATGETENAKKDIDKLAEMDVKKFDKKWCGELMDKHDKKIKKLENIQSDKDFTNANIKNLVGDVLPKLKAHHDLLKQCNDKLK